MKLDYAPLWVILRNVSPQLYSFDGISAIASGLGHPLYTQHAKLTPNRFGLVKVKVVMKLDRIFSSAIRVWDRLGNSYLVSAEFSHVPQKCGSCQEFGHLPLRCPNSIALPKALPRDFTVGKDCSSKDTPSVAIQLIHKSKTSDNTLGSALVDTQCGKGDSKSGSSMVEVLQELGPAVRARSLPSSQRTASVSSSQTWTRVVKRSKHVVPTTSNSHESKKQAPLTSSQFHEKEDIIKAAKKVLRIRPSSHSPVTSYTSVKSKRSARRRLRQHFLAEVQIGDPILPISEASSPTNSSASVSFDRGCSLTRIALPSEA